MPAHFPIPLLSCFVKIQSLNSSKIRAHKLHWHHGAVTSPFSLPFSFVHVTQLFIQERDNAEFVNSWQFVVIYYGMGLEMVQSP